MWLLRVFLLMFAFWRAAGDTDCLVETLKCSRLRPDFPTHKDLLTPRELEKVCRQQDWFFQCLDNLVDAGVTCEDGISPHMQRARGLFKSFCSGNSWQKRYYEMAPCINRQNTETCTASKFLLQRHRNKGACFLLEKAVNCIAVTLVASCGMEAGQLFHHLLRMTSDGDNCYMLGSEILFLPMFQEREDDKAACNEALANLVSSTAPVPELEASMDYSPSVAAGDFISYPNDSVRDYLADFLPSTPDFGKTSEFDASYKTSRLGIFDVMSTEKLNKDKGTTYIKPENALRFHGNNSVSTYLLLSNSNDLELDFCENKYEDGKKMFVCIIVIREEDPICLEGGRKRNMTGINPEDVIPEDIDPELGARLYAMFPYAYYFRPYETMQERMFKHVHDTNKNVFNRIREYVSASPQTTGERVRVRDSVTKKVGDLRTKLEEFIKDSPVFHATNSPDPESLDKDLTIWDLLEKYANVSQFERQAKSLDMSKSDVPPNIASGKSNDTNNFAKEQTLLSLLVEEIDWIIENVTKEGDTQWLSPTIVRIKSYAREGSHLVNMTCGRVNECHPNATDIHRCLYVFSLDDKEPVEVPPQARRRRPRELPTDMKLKSNAKKIDLQANERPGHLENSESIILSDQSYKNLLQTHVMEAESEHANFFDALSGVLPELPDTEAIKFVLLEPDAFLDSEASHKIKPSESIYNELNKAEDIDQTQEENPKPMSSTELSKKVGDQEPSDDLLLDDLFALIASENMRDEL